MCKMKAIVGILVVIARVGLSANVQVAQSSEEGLVAKWHSDWEVRERSCR